MLLPFMLILLRVRPTNFCIWRKWIYANVVVVCFFHCYFISDGETKSFGFLFLNTMRLISPEILQIKWKKIELKWNMICSNNGCELRLISFGSEKSFSRICIYDGRNTNNFTISNFAFPRRNKCMYKKRECIPFAAESINSPNSHVCARAVSVSDFVNRIIGLAINLWNICSSQSLFSAVMNFMNTT